MRGVLPPLGLVAAAIAGLILIQPNLSSAALLGDVTGFLLLFLAGARLAPPGDPGGRRAGGGGRCAGHAPLS